jgi:hypothetical protein
MSYFFDYHEILDPKHKWYLQEYGYLSLYDIDGTIFLVNREYYYYDNKFRFCIDQIMWLKRGWIGFRMIPMIFNIENKLYLKFYE